MWCDRGVVLWSVERCDVVEMWCGVVEGWVPCGMVWCGSIVVW